MKRAVSRLAIYRSALPDATDAFEGLRLLPTAPLLAMLGGCDGDNGGSGPSGDIFTPPVEPAVKPRGYEGYPEYP
ncbi:hypothetical protein CU102_08310 [Phyllobacterium brassicacearum]|uniref:Uncharacterized protein n=1 Tax=Phyllobacterium brassicacearum TaxID=314235 RepID=A0A2P7BSE3_9HYPH|nr:hypothetical protein [Phyllobacterium brassicacearum]PSH69384.1 hypothetical protein CU102_08310 [Phyllobacterium brassicacearum]